jgi:hypothetical protein
MMITFFDRDDTANELNGTLIRDGARLLQILQSLQNRIPFFSELVGENGFCLLVGIGKLGCAQYSRCDGSTPYLMAVAPNPSSQDQSHSFLMAGTSTPISGRYCMPFETVMAIAGHFQKTGTIYPKLSWEAI